MKKLLFIVILIYTSSCSVKPEENNSFPLGVHQVKGVNEIRVEFTDKTRCYVEEFIDGVKTMYKCEYVVISDNDKMVYKVNFRQKIMSGCSTEKASNIIGNVGVLFHHSQLSVSDWQLDCSQETLTLLNNK
ncbi:hypothetical protein [Flammeovirga pacifica]|uniref:Uncharacterized protein n=1 Tax=Flammeovirga pacifica TaxID=915059 RepID=A0A1S1YT85_FLAPC|nr:hypothetical protein [Flammeovirga pacifica]OHX64229.1 hypothetical protein NH26_21740 [Flammeovirga pacifica]